MCAALVLTVTNNDEQHLDGLNYRQPRNKNFLNETLQQNWQAHLLSNQLRALIRHKCPDFKQKTIPKTSYVT